MSSYCVISKRSGDIREILSCGSIRAEDLGYLAILGSGNCGTVYKSVEQNTLHTLLVTINARYIGHVPTCQEVTELRRLVKVREES